MRPISNLPVVLLGLLSSWQMVLFWASVYILVYGFRDKRHIPLILRNSLCLLLCVVNYGLFQCTVGYTSQNAVTQSAGRFITVYASLPAGLAVSVCLLLSALEIFLILFLRNWFRSHITSASIKETIETLPVGICAFEPDGRIALRNKTMEQLCRSLTGQPLLNGKEFMFRLKEQKEDLADFAVSLPDYSVWSFTEDEIRSQHSRFTLLIAYNVTETYQKTRMLVQRQETMRQLNQRLKEYGRQIEQVIAQQEILNAKVRVHDELGSGLLAIKHCLVSGGSDRERADLLERLKGIVSFLQQEAVVLEEDEYSLILSTAERLGVAVWINGRLPVTEPNKHVMAVAIHECFTNILRHTDGDTLFADITQDAYTLTARFTDNNTRPFGEITESGGLSTLRNLVLQAKGDMHISTKPRFCLTITLPKECENYGISSFDCG